jgi:hypothetical protein
MPISCYLVTKQNAESFFASCRGLSGGLRGLAEGVAATTKSVTAIFAAQINA